MLAKWPAESPSSHEPTVREKLENPPRVKDDINELNNEVLSSITNRDFLKVPKNERLKYLTDPSLNSSDLSTSSSVNFKFKFDWKLNHELYLKTTAGQLLPTNVREVICHGTRWVRNWIEWEFFTQTGQRLIIKDKTQLMIDKMWTQVEVQENENKVAKSVEQYQERSEYDIILAAKRRWINAEITEKLLIPQIEKDESNRSIRIEEIITQFERVKDDYSDDFWSSSIIENWEYSKKFLAYYINTIWITEDEKKLAKNNIWIAESDIAEYSRKRRTRVFQSFRWVTELTEDEKKNLTDIPPWSLEAWKKENFWMRLSPWSKEAAQLFTLAWMSMNPKLWTEEAKNWWLNEWLHYILQHESWGVVGRVNYTAKHIPPEEFKSRAVNRSDLKWKQLAWKEFWVTSTAIWLWQLTMSNEYYLPRWRNSIWVPIEEAIGMLQYIRDRYWNPDIARKMYWTTGHYTHPEKWTQYKSFDEGY